MWPAATPRGPPPRWRRSRRRPPLAIRPAAPPGSQAGIGSSLAKPLRVPVHELSVRRERGPTMKVSCIIPAYNEAARIPAVGGAGGAGTGLGFELALDRIAPRGRARVVNVPLNGVTHPRKRKKYGAVKGFRQEMRASSDIVRQARRAGAGGAPWAAPPPPLAPRPGVSGPPAARRSRGRRFAPPAGRPATAGRRAPRRRDHRRRG